MIEIPEAASLARQINAVLSSKRIVNVVANQSPHKFAWFCGDPQEYNSILIDKTIQNAVAYGGLVEIQAETTIILLGDGVNLRYHKEGELRPKKHQLMIEFEDGSALSASVQMYGGIWCFNAGEFKNPYYLVAKQKPSPLSHDFTDEYFKSIISRPEVQKLSVKALMATEQRIPGLGNGVLQDILWNAKLHPKRKAASLSEEEINNLFMQLKAVLQRMTELGGRNTEKDLFGNPGSYRTVMSKNNSESLCPECGETIAKENYLGGSIYYCRGCQEI